MKTTYVLFFALILISTASIADGQSDFETKCTACHGFGVAGAPKLGDAKNWAPRIKRGIDMLYTNAINGFNGGTWFMPAKGGFSDLSDDQIKAIVDYMVAQSQ